MALEEWNKRLAEHFGALARDRQNIPRFALEHGLATAELLALQNELRIHIRSSVPGRNHGLVWVVYAAEIGYGYAGNEYWQTFEEKTPGWTLNGRRDWIRDAFIAFQKEYASAKPSGPWAENFSIIAWPITHAILPRDLQQQLARILYDLRHSFSAELFDEPQRLGEFIAARSWNASESSSQPGVGTPLLVSRISFKRRRSLDKLPLRFSCRARKASRRYSIRLRLSALETTLIASGAAVTGYAARDAQRRSAQRFEV